MITSIGFSLIILIGKLVYDLQFSMAGLFISYVSLLVINAILLVYSHVVYLKFKEVKSALVVSMVLFQFVLFTGGFSVPIEFLPHFMKYMAYANPIYHLNQIYILIWNQMFELDQNMLIAMGYVIALLMISWIVIEFSKRKK